jgi:hypothetical protein
MTRISHLLQDQTTRSTMKFTLLSFALLVSMAEGQVLSLTEANFNEMTAGTLSVSRRTDWGMIVADCRG